MSELFQLVLQHLRGMWNRRWIGMAAAWLAAIMGVAIALRVPDRYEASARVYVDTQSLLRSVMTGLSVQPSLEQQAALVSRTLLARPNVEKLVTLTRVGQESETSVRKDRLVDTLLASIKLNAEGRTNTYLITYRDTDRQRAQGIVQTLLAILAETRLGDKRQETDSAVNFLEEQINRYEQSLQAAENRLKLFKLKYLGVAGQGGQPGQDFFGRISQLSDVIASAKLELRAATQTRDSYRQALAGESATVAVDQRATGAPIPVPEIDQRIAAQKTKLDELLRTYTEQHPDVAGTRRVLVELEEQRKAEIRESALRPTKAGQVAEQNPVFQKIRLSLADAEANVASLSAKVGMLEGQYAQLKAQAQLVPQVEAEYAQLTRDYDVQKKTYNDLLARRQATTLGAEVQESEAMQFRIIDPPRVSSNPIWPSRLVLLGLAFVAALGTGLLASFAANEIRPTFHGEHALGATSGRPVLGSLSMWPSAAMLRKKRLDVALFFSGLAGLAASFAGVIAFTFLMARVA